MKKEELMKLLRNPAKYRKEKQALKQSGASQESSKQSVQRKQDQILLGVVLGVGALLVLTLWVMTSSQKKADDLTAALDPEQVKGLFVENTEFNPNTGVTYVQVREGQDRNVSVSNLGTTLPIISRFNYRSFTPENYEVIGAAPWALTTNFSSNLADPELMRYLLSKDEMINAFLARPDVEPLLEDPQLLLAFTKDNAAMEEFFDSDTVKSVISNEKMLRSVAGSRFMSYLLISKAVKYFRDRPKEAAAIIDANPYLKELQQNPNIQLAVKENPYLKNIASILLKSASSPAKNSVQTAKPAVSNTKKKK